MVGCKFKDFNDLSRIKLNRRDDKDVRFVNREGLLTNREI
jgi:hypothetical protein